MAYGIARANASWRNTLLLLIILPFWTSFLVRVYAWIGPPAEQRAHQQCADGARHHRRAHRHDADGLRDVHRHRVLVSAVHDPAAVFEPREARQHAARGRGGSRRNAVPRVPAHHAAAVHAGRHRGLHARVHSRGGRVRDPAPAWRHGFTDDRARAVG